MQLLASHFSHPSEGHEAIIDMVTGAVDINAPADFEYFG